MFHYPFSSANSPYTSELTAQYTPVEDLMSLRESRLKPNGTWYFSGHRIGPGKSICNDLDHWDAFLESIEFSCFCLLASEYYHVCLEAWPINGHLDNSWRKKVTCGAKQSKDIQRQRVRALIEPCLLRALLLSFFSSITP